MCPIVPTLQCGLGRSNFSFAIFSLSPRLHLRRNQIIPVGLVIRANEFLLLHQFIDNLPIKLRETLREALTENFKPAMPTPEIPHPVPPIVHRFAFQTGSDVTLSLPQKPCPDSVCPEHCFKFSPPNFSDPEPAVDDEPRRCQSLRRALHLRDDFLRDQSRRLLIARKAHRVFPPPLGRRTHVRGVTKHLRQRH